MHNNNNNNSFVTKRVFLSCDCELYIGRRMWAPIFTRRKESMCTRRTLLSRSKLGLTEAASLHAIIEQAQKEALKHKDVGRIHPSQEGIPGIDSKPWKICNGLPRSLIFLVNLLICRLAESQFAVTMWWMRESWGVSLLHSPYYTWSSKSYTELVQIQPDEEDGDHPPLSDVRMRVACRIRQTSPIDCHGDTR
jgi:hypothetical protein